MNNTHLCEVVRSFMQRNFMTKCQKQHKIKPASLVQLAYEHQPQNSGLSGSKV